MQTLSKQECLQEISQHKTIRLLVPKSVKTDLGPILDAYSACGHNTEVGVFETVPNKKELEKMLNFDTDAVLMVCPPRRAPATLVDGPFLKNVEKSIPIGLFPLRNKTSLQSFATTILKVHNKKKDVLSIALLSQKYPRYSHLVDRMKASLTGEIASFRWTSHELTREDMIKGLRLGLGLSIYFGHGRPTGWVGYYGLRAHHFKTNNGQALGAMLNLCCNTASRRKVGYSFAEKMVMKGVTSASFAAVRPTLHTDNTRWSVGLCKAIEQGARSLDELLLQAAPLNNSAIEHYRIIGDPLASIYSSWASVEVAKGI